jgi:hypothetical protein
MSAKIKKIGKKIEKKLQERGYPLKPNAIRHGCFM